MKAGYSSQVNMNAKPFAQVPPSQFDRGIKLVFNHLGPTNMTGIGEVPASNQISTTRKTNNKL
jgi:hypothetical protein